MPYQMISGSTNTRCQEEQLKAEYEVLEILCAYPDKSQTTTLTANHFTHPMYRDIYNYLQRADPADEEAWLLSAQEQLPDVAFEFFIKFAASDTFYAKLPTLERQLEELRQKRVIDDLYQQMDAGKIRPDEMADLLAKAITPIGKPPKEMTPEEIVELVLKKDKILRFNRFQCFRKGLPLAECCTHVVAGYTSRGKSALVMNWIMDLAESHKVIYFNLEMSEAKVWKRFTAIHSGIPLGQIVSENPAAPQAIYETAHYLKSRGMQLYTGSRTIDQVRQMIMQNSAGCVPVVVIDHIQYIQTSKRNQEERIQISEIMKTLNGLAKDGKCTPILLSQINRGGSQDATLNNLQGSAAIAQDADTVIIIEYMDPDKAKDADTVMRIKVEKARDAATGDLTFVFHKSYQIFEDITHEWAAQHRQQQGQLV